VSTAETGQATARAIKEQAVRLGLSWQMNPGTMLTTTDVVLDGSAEGTKVAAIPLQSVIPTERVMCLLIPQDGLVYIIGSLGTLPPPGSMVARLRRGSSDQTFTTAVAAFISFDVADYDPWSGWDDAIPDRWSAPFPGWFQCNGRIVWASNATSRRAAFINTNGSTSGTGTIGGASIQAAGNGTTQCGGVGSAFLQTGEYVGLRGIQNSGGNLVADSGSDGGSCLEVFYTGQTFA
jgi:hypothetical protein